MAAQRIPIGISSCLLGACVRYDGGHRLEQSLVDTLGPHVRWIPICPEADCGLGVPRPPMRLVGSPTRPRIVEIESGIDHTDRLLAWAGEKLGSLSGDGNGESVGGFIFKARSPSCALRNAEISGNRGLVNGPGLFSRAVMAAFNNMPVADEEEMRTPDACRRFLKEARGYRRI